MYEIVYAAGAAKQIRSLNPEIRERVRNAVARTARDPTAGKPLQGPLRPYRSYRVGDYRILYRVEAMRLIVFVVAVAHRRDAYR